jgi:succinate dehydrogenase / fumarate reductase, membrane anchor subunit
MTVTQPPAGAELDELLEPPRSKTVRPRSKQRSNYELYSWLFMRVSGLALIVLVIGHLIIMTTLDGGVTRLNFGFVAGRWSSPFWRTWDLLQLILAELHGTNGLRTIINDYASKDGTRFWLKMLLYSSTTIIVLLGTVVIFTFDPNLH